MSVITEKFQYGEHNVELETGKIARQAYSVKVTMGDTVVLVTVVAKKQVAENAGFFPLTVNYFEKAYSAGKIPGGFYKREGRPTEKEVLTSRLIDRPIRPLFPDGFYNEVQVIASVLSLDDKIDSDIPALLGASAALTISGVPFNGPIGAARVGYINNEYVLNPSNEQLTESDLDLVVAGTESAVLMVESEAKMLSEETMLGAVMFGHEQMQIAIAAIQRLAEKAGAESWNWQPPAHDTELKQLVDSKMRQPVTDAYAIREKLERIDKLSALQESLLAEIEDETKHDEALSLFGKLGKDIVRSQILAGQDRIDGRDTKTVRPITVETGILPRAHGSALFTRGETQAIVVTTLGTSREAQIVDALSGEYRDHFLLHYNFPPYSVGETGFMTGPKRREIGHGRLARRGVQALVPGDEDFPYVIRVVSEITESNGSSSMATVCGTSLSLMDAGVPMKAPVAGIAMGLIKEADKHAVLTDILGDEDHLGDMDFKVAGTEDGITALQMDIKIEGITKDIMQQALAQARDGRLHILGIMNEHLGQAREDMSPYAPRIYTIKIPTDRIADVIGRGGATIKDLTERTQTTIEIEDDGTVKVAATTQESADQALEEIRLLTANVEVGKIYQGKVIKIMDFGAFVNILPGRDGLVHISQIKDSRVNEVTDELEEGEEVKVKVMEIDRQGRVRLTMKASELAGAEEI